MAKRKKNPGIKHEYRVEMRMVDENSKLMRGTSAAANAFLAEFPEFNVWSQDRREDFIEDVYDAFASVYFLEHETKSADRFLASRAVKH